MAKFRKKPVVIEAWLFVEGKPHGIPTWVARAAHDLGDGNLSIQTLEGLMVAKPGDWIIQGVKGEIYPCKADIFDATYEPVEQELSS